MSTIKISICDFCKKITDELNYELTISISGTSTSTSGDLCSHCYEVLTNTLKEKFNEESIVKARHKEVPVSKNTPSEINDSEIRRVPSNMTPERAREINSLSICEHNSLTMREDGSYCNNCGERVG